MICFHTFEYRSRAKHRIPHSFSENRDMAQENTSESSWTKMTREIWADKPICPEVRLVNKPWYVRNGQDLNADAGFEKPVIFLVIQKDKKKAVTYGPVVEIGWSTYNRGRVEKTALLTLCLGENNKFVSVVVDEDQFDLTACVDHIPQDVITSDVCDFIERKEVQPWYTCFTGLLDGCQVIMFPRMLDSWEKTKGRPWKRAIKLKVKSPERPSLGSKTPSTSGGTASTGKRSKRPRPAAASPPVEQLTVDFLEKDVPEGASERQLVVSDAHTKRSKASSSDGRSQSSGARPEVVSTHFF